MKVKLACAPAVADTAAVPPLHARIGWLSLVQPAENDSPVSSTRVPVAGSGKAGATSKASTTTA